MDAEPRRRQADSELTGAVIGAAMDVHRELGPGLLESVYEECLCLELRDRGIEHRRQVEVPVIYKGKVLGVTYRLDVMVEQVLALELKASETMAAVHSAQLLTYLKLLDCRLGLLLNFGQETLRDGVVRVANQYPA